MSPFVEAEMLPQDFSSLRFFFGDEKEALNGHFSGHLKVNE